MNKLIFVFALALVLKPILPVVSYIINYNYIVAELCVNKSKPELECNGKCHLKSELAKASDGTEGDTATQKLKVADAEVLFFNPIARIVFPLRISFANRVPDNYLNHYTYANIISHFHPPAV